MYLKTSRDTQFGWLFVGLCISIECYSKSDAVLRISVDMLIGRSPRFGRTNGLACAVVSVKTGLRSLTGRVRKRSGLAVHYGSLGDNTVHIWHAAWSIWSRPKAWLGHCVGTLGCGERVRVEGGRVWYRRWFVTLG